MSLTGSTGTVSGISASFVSSLSLTSATFDSSIPYKHPLISVYMGKWVYGFMSIRQMCPYLPFTHSFTHLLFYSFNSNRYGPQLQLREPDAYNAALAACISFSGIHGKR